MEATQKTAKAQVKAEVEQLFGLLYSANGGDTVKEVADLLDTHSPEVLRLFKRVSSQAQAVVSRQQSNASIARRKHEERKRAFDDQVGKGRRVRS